MEVNLSLRVTFSITKNLRNNSFQQLETIQATAGMRQFLTDEEAQALADFPIFNSWGNKE